jgi:hypothetical protein
MAGARTTPAEVKTFLNPSGSRAICTVVGFKPISEIPQAWVSLTCRQFSFHQKEFTYAYKNVMTIL